MSGESTAWKRSSVTDWRYWITYSGVVTAHSEAGAMKAAEDTHREKLHDGSLTVHPFQVDMTVEPLLEPGTAIHVLDEQGKEGA
jgi:hypothetical protein